MREDSYIRNQKYKLMHDGIMYNMEFRYFPREQKSRLGPEAVAMKKRLHEAAMNLRKKRE